MIIQYKIKIYENFLKTRKCGRYVNGILFNLQKQEVLPCVARCHTTNMRM
jgi:hypothetical protein